MGILLTVNGIYNRSYQRKDLSTSRASTQLSRLEYTADGGQGLSWTYYDYTYDSAGRIATYAPSVAAKYAEQYTYDELEQLTKVTKDYKTVASYTYDTAGNILTAQNATGTHTYCFKSMRDIITFSENGITQRHRAEVVAEIAWNDVMEIGIKWKQFAHSIPGWRLMPDRRCYIVYFSNHRLSREERACLGQRNHQNEAASGIIYRTDMAYRTVCRTFVPNPYITKYAFPQCPAFSDLCAAFAVESSIGQCAYVSKDGVVQKMDSLQVPAARRQYRKEIWCGILGFCAYMILLLLPSAILILRDMAR